MSWKRRLLWTVGPLLAIVFVAGGYFGYRFWVEEGCECGAPEKTPFTTHNPFRDRQPETVTTQYLQALHEGRCAQLPPTLFVSGSAQTNACAVKYPLNVWEYRSRESDGGTLTLGYSVGYGADQTTGNGFWVSLVRNGSAWQIDSMSTYY